MELGNSQSMVVLIVGVTGMHPKLAWFPDSTIDQYIAFDATDANDTLHNLPPVANKVTHVFWIAIQVRESEEENVRVNPIMLANVRNVLKSASPSRLAHITVQTDARVLAEQYMWGAITPHAKNQAFNCTNGDVFTWKSVWKVLCDIFEVEFVPFDETEEFDFVGMMKEKGKIWDEIVKKHGLYKTKLEEIACFAGFKNVLNFGFQHVCGMNKSQEYGFFGYTNTLKSLGNWVDRLRKMKIIP
ncbi:hypothetical protein SLE2022_165010 [Rubroshorea leprosula]